MEEDFYIDGLHQGNEQVFKRIFEKYHTRLCYFARSLLPFSSDAEDVVQDAFVKLWQKKADFHSLHAIKAFLYISVKNRCLNIIAHDQVTKKYTGHLGQVPPSDIMQELLKAEALEKVYQALQKLPSGCREVLQLSYFEEMKNKEVAAHLQVSVNTVKTQKQRGLHLLRALMKITSIFL